MNGRGCGKNMVGAECTVEKELVSSLFIELKSRRTPNAKWGILSESSTLDASCDLLPNLYQMSDTVLIV